MADMQPDRLTTLSEVGRKSTTKCKMNRYKEKKGKKDTRNQNAKINRFSCRVVLLECLCIALFVMVALKVVA
jgi:hypothetical protein